jgi:hypothetical protein
MVRGALPVGLLAGPVDHTVVLVLLVAHETTDTGAPGVKPTRAEVGMCTVVTVF